MIPTQTTHFVKPARSTLFAVFAGMLIAPAVSAEVNLRDRIDHHIQNGTKQYTKHATPIADDAEFLRRIYLDLVGYIPGADDARKFFADKAADKRGKLVEKLLTSHEHARHLQHKFDVLFMDRRAGKEVPDAAWEKFLYESFVANKPYDQLVREILLADGSDPKNRAPARFYLDRNGEPDQLTRDISRVFLGMNLTCAQCHDHPLVNGFHQEHYFGVYAFLNRSYMFKDKNLKKSIFAEKGTGDEVKFQSVFLPKVSKKTGPRLPEGKEVKEPSFPKGKEYVKPVKKGERGVPKFSRREQLAKYLTNPDNERFPRTTVNRVWYFLFGRGLIDPIEFDHDENPPSHPELLKEMTEQFVAHNFDLRWLIREIVLSKTYQRSSVVGEKAAEQDPAWFAAAAVRPLTPEQFGFSLLHATGYADVQERALGKKASEAALYARLAPQLRAIITLYGQAAGEPAIDQTFEATLDQTLFLNNSTQIMGWLRPAGGNLTDRLQAMKEDSKLAEELFLSVFTRLPTADETRDVSQFLKTYQGNRTSAIQDLTWALLTSAEFRFNH